MARRGSPTGWINDLCWTQADGLGNCGRVKDKTDLRGFMMAGCGLLVLVGVGNGVAQTAQPRPVTHRTKLRQDTEIQGYPCAKGYAWFYADGKLDELLR